MCYSAQYEQVRQSENLSEAELGNIDSRQRSNKDIRTESKQNKKNNRDNRMSFIYELLTLFAVLFDNKNKCTALFVHKKNKIKNILRRACLINNLFIHNIF